MVFFDSKKYSLHILLNKFLVVLTGGMVFLSMCAAAAFIFFVNLKLMLVVAVVWVTLIDRNSIKFLLGRYQFYGLLIVTCLYGIILGFVNKNPGAHSELALYGYAIAAYLFLFGILARQKNILSAFEIGAKVSIVMIIFIFYFLFFVQDGSLRDYLADKLNFIIQHPDGYVKAHSLQTTSLLFLMPVMLGFYYQKKSFTNGSLLMALALMILLSGRKSAIILLMAFVPILSIMRFWKRKSVMDTLLFVSPFVMSWVIFLIIANSEMPMLFKSVADGFAVLNIETVSENNLCAFETFYTAGVDPAKIGAAIRQAQANILFEHIKAVPFQGRGLGYVVDSCMRSETQPWRFELTYLALAMNVGLFGIFFIAGTYVLWVKKAFSNGCLRDSAFPFVFGSVFFIVCSATNPYLFSVENVWIFFLPYFFALISELNQSNESVF